MTRFKQNRAVMVLGTSSGAGKSLFVAALCRIFSRKGIKVSPFKSQNMALNSFVTKTGGEIGRAQALQAMAAGIEPTVTMNPVLLKASGEKGIQVIINGKAEGHMSAKEYYSKRETLWRVVLDAIEGLRSEYELIVAEGAGSPAEINLNDVDIANMAVADALDAPAVLVGDIEKGGVFASLYGTVLLARHRERIKGFVINKFRGERGILTPGLSMIRELTGIPVLGVVPYLEGIGLPEEDGLHLKRGTMKMPDPGVGSVKVVIVHLPFISNFTDFDPLFLEVDTEVVYSTSPEVIKGADLVILPGTKSTVRDLLFLRQMGIDEAVRHAAAEGREVLGICGGYQMLSERILDDGIESDQGEIEGLGLLEMETVFSGDKITRSVAGIVASEEFATNCKPDTELRGYEIHMGRSYGDASIFRLWNRDEKIRGDWYDGSRKGSVWGTYVHGIFDNDTFRRGYLNFVRQKKGLEPIENSVSYHDEIERAIDNLADRIEESIDIGMLMRITGI
ncbi:MAG: cobyric acid synthase [Nitrospirae bacterium]|nr:MAG: cobyric acid synthase [Nitrospirota bacterium]